MKEDNVIGRMLGEVLAKQGTLEDALLCYRTTAAGDCQEEVKTYCQERSKSIMHQLGISPP
jgi:hypothetical protein